MENQNKEVLYGLYDDEEILLKAVKQAKNDHLDIMDVYTPFPVHGLDPLLGLSESPRPIRCPVHPGAWPLPWRVCRAGE